MDYQRIYLAFIADRRAKECVLTDSSAHYETHHILPRALGGDDSRSNLIALTPEDHFFAHCCLAKIYGGTMWFVVKAMGGGWSRTPGRAGLYAGRAMVGVAKRRSAANTAARMRREFEAGDLAYFAKSGSENVLHNATIYQWVNLDTGEVRESTIQGMHLSAGGSRAHWTSVQTGARKSHLGWAKQGAAIRIRSLKGKTLRYLNRDGRIYSGTQGDFCAFTGLSVAAVSRVSRYGAVTRCGWRLDAGSTEVR